MPDEVPIPYAMSNSERDLIAALWTVFGYAWVVNPELQHKNRELADIVCFAPPCTWFLYYDKKTADDFATQICKNVKQAQKALLHIFTGVSVLKGSTKSSDFVLNKENCKQMYVVSTNSNAPFGSVYDAIRSAKFTKLAKDKGFDCTVDVLHQDPLLVWSCAQHGLHLVDYLWLSKLTDTALKTGLACIGPKKYRELVLASAGLNDEDCSRIKPHLYLIDSGRISMGSGAVHHLEEELSKPKAFHMPDHMREFWSASGYLRLIDKLSIAAQIERIIQENPGRLVSKSIDTPFVHTSIHYDPLKSTHDNIERFIVAPAVAEDGKCSYGLSLFPRLGAGISTGVVQGKKAIVGCFQNISSSLDWPFSLPETWDKE